MSILFDQDKAFSYIYRNINGTFETTNRASSTVFDLFSDNASVGDAIYFGRYSPCWSFHDIKFNIGTALSATSITIVWEIMSGTSWVAIPSVTDGTNNFQNTGVNTVAFDVPQNMCYNTTNWYRRIDIGGNKFANWVRARITAVSGITEGGATQTDTVKYKDFTITCANEPSLTLASIQSAATSGSWLARTGVNAVDTTGKYTIIRPHLFWSGTTGFAETMKMIELGENNYPAGFRNYGSGIFKLGILDASGKGDEGCYLYMHARFDSGYDYVYRFQAYATVVRRKVGQYGAFVMGGVFKFVDSVFISDHCWYLPSAVASGSNWTRSIYADNDLLYLYSGNLAIDTFKSLDAWQGVLCGVGNPAVFANTDINSKEVMRYYSAQIDLIDCINILKSNITNHSPSDGYDRHVKVKYNINLKIVNENGNPISSVNVKLTDTNGDETFSVNTEADGKIVEQTVMVYDKWWEYADSWALHEDEYNDFTIKIFKAGYKTYKTEFTLDEKVDWTIALQKVLDNNFSKRVNINN